MYVSSLFFQINVKFINALKTACNWYHLFKPQFSGTNIQHVVSFNIIGQVWETVCYWQFIIKDNSIQRNDNNMYLIQNRT